MKRASMFLFNVVYIDMKEVNTILTPAIYL